MSVYCSDVVCTFYSEADDNADSRESPAELKVTVTNAGSGPYLVIETARWAFDDPAELVAILKMVKKRCFKLFKDDGLL